MIIQCSHCSARFRIDDAKLAKGAVKVRCAKCKEVFVVEPEAPVAPPEPVAAVPAAAAPTHAEDFSANAPAPPPPARDESAFSFDQDEPASPAETPKQPAAEEFDWQTTAAATGGSQGFDLSATDVSLPSQQAEPVPGAATASDNDFDFGDVDFSQAPATGAETAVAPSMEDSSMDFGEIDFSSQTASAAADTFAGDADRSPEKSTAAASEDFFSFNTPEAAEPPGATKVKHEEPAAGSVNLEEFNFGEIAAAAVAINEGGGKEAEQSYDAFAAATAASMSAEEEELPPSSLTSRKKSGSLFPVLVICGAIVLIIATAGAGIYFIGGPKTFSKMGLGFLVDWYGDKKVEDGGVSLRDVTASYVNNGSAGELFVVRGEAVNNFKSPRASVQVKVTVLGQGGAVLVSKTAFCGNLLSNEQLAVLPQSKIDEAMSNQFGDSLANMGLKPGAAIGFVVVLSGVPKEAVDYTVQVSGSTVAAK